MTISISWWHPTHEVEAAIAFAGNRSGINKKAPRVELGASNRRKQKRKHLVF